MGVPAFYRWLSEKYPKIVQDMLEKRNAVVDGVEIPLNLLEPNPNGMEYDNLYIDLNGLIHPCSHPEDREAPTTEAEMYLNVTKYIDRLFAACRPRRLLFLAIDGVAPRAKMNQQRARRFRAAQEARERVEMMEEVVAEMTSLGLSLPPSSGAAWDSNVITPGTEFMSHLSLYLWYYVLDRMNRIPSWRNVKIILSDASEPGEGEHKIMRFIRAQRSQPGYDPNQRHILHGLDADLIMLALATHELHFTILREEVTFGKKKDKVKSEGQRLLDLESAAISALRPEDEWVYGKPLQCLHIRILREYLYFEFRVLEQTLPFKFDIERIIDDFVFVCFFVGNDFLPHLPSLDIRDGALDFLIEVYKDLLPSMGEYVTSPGGCVNLRQLDVLLSKVGEVEDQVFQTRKAAEDREQQKKNKQSQYNKNTSGKSIRDNLLSQGDPRSQLTALPRSGDKKSSQENEAAAAKIKHLLQKIDTAKAEGQEKSKEDDEGEEMEFDADVNGKKNSKRKLDEVTSSLFEGGPASAQRQKQQTNGDVSFTKAPAKMAIDKKGLADAVKNKLKAKEQKIIEGNKDTVVDTVKFHEYGWKARYYEDNYKKEDIAASGGLKRMCLTYIEGLCWVLKYYYQGCPSWNWYYPFHYAPFASDLVNVDSYDIQFQLSKPFKPVEQLLAVLPADSVAALPEACSWLMLDKESPIKDLYSDDIPIDPNGKILPWLWVVLLPFIDENRITAAMALCLDNMTEEETKRNSYGSPLLFIHADHDLAKAVSDRVLGDDKAHSFTAEEGQGIQGNLAVTTDSKLQSPIGDTLTAPARPLGAFSDIQRNNVFCYRYEYPEELAHLSALLEGAVPVEPTLSEYDGMPRRPPRLNRGGFNIVDMARSMKSEQQSQHGAYVHHTHGNQTFQQSKSSSFFQSHAQMQFNHRNDGGYGGEEMHYGGYDRSYDVGKGGGKSYGGKGYGGRGSQGGYDYGGKGGKGYDNSGGRQPLRRYEDGGSKGYSSRGYENGSGRGGGGYKQGSRGGTLGSGYHGDHNGFSHGAALSGISNRSTFSHQPPRSAGAPPSQSDYYSQPPPSFMYSSSRDYQSSRSGGSQYTNQFAQVKQSFSNQREPVSSSSGGYSSRPPPPSFSMAQSGHGGNYRGEQRGGKGDYQQRDPRRR